MNGMRLGTTARSFDDLLPVPFAGAACAAAASGRMSDVLAAMSRWTLVDQRGRRRIAGAIGSSGLHGRYDCGVRRREDTPGASPREPNAAASPGRPCPG